MTFTVAPTVVTIRLLRKNLANGTVVMATW